MMSKDKGVTPAGSGSRASHGAAKASPPKASIPNAVWPTADTAAGHLAMWAVRQSPYVCPDGLPDALTQFIAAFPADDAGLSEWDSEDALYNAVWAAIEASPAVVAWNTPKSGHEATIAFVSRYDRPSPDDDFIDLYALAGNVTRSLWNEEAGQ